MKRKVRRTPKDYLIAGLLLLAFFWLSWMVFDIFQKEEYARHAADAARAEVKTLGEREKSLQGDLANLDSERGKEASLRETYGVAKPGEEVIIVIPPGTNGEQQSVPWWKKLLGFFGL